MRNATREAKNAVRDNLLKFILPLSVVALTPACAAEVDRAPEGQGTNETQPAGTPVPVASLVLAGGNVVEFYGFERTALISETGDADTAPSFQAPKGPLPADHIVDVWRQLAPEKAVPQALTDLQTRLMNLPAPLDTQPAANARRAQLGGLDQPEPPVTDDGLLAAPDGCNNGCCDLSWLSTFSQCNQGGYAYNWFMFNKIWSSLSTSDDAIKYNGMVCSAQGISTYSVNMQGPGGTWPVPQATWRSFSWVATSDWLFGWDERAITSTVNSPSDPHLHTYCGQVNWD